jgi:hypothetical protein
VTLDAFREQAGTDDDETSIHDHRLRGSADRAGLTASGPERIKKFAKHPAETCSPGAVASSVGAMYYAARSMMPDAELNWLKQMKTRL